MRRFPLLLGASLLLTACVGPDARLAERCGLFPDVDGDGAGDALTEARCVAMSQADVDAGTVPAGWSETATDCDDGDPDVTEARDWFVDADEDGFGSGEAETACAAPEGTVDNGDDCDDDDPAVHPLARELCDDAGVDEDCDGAINAADDDLFGASTAWTDADEDGYGDPESPQPVCGVPPAGLVDNDLDCDDTDAELNPTTVWYPDFDGDGYGVEGDLLLRQCTRPDRFVRPIGDCDDTLPKVNPAAVELCNGLDDDCDGLTDDEDEIPEDFRFTWWEDDDVDGFGDPDKVVRRCSPIDGLVPVADDCDDTDPLINPAVPEICNEGIDDNCNGDADDADPSLDPASARETFLDADGDGFGVFTSVRYACAVPTGFAELAGDCDDGDGGINPAATETCNEGVDDDCDGLSDDDDPSLDTSTGEAFWIDVDGDGYGDPDYEIAACRAPSRFVDNDEDCDDADDTQSPDGTEACNGEDDDCDTDIDEGLVGSGAACPADDCDDILSDRSAASGSYWVDFGGDGDTEEVDCDMTLDGGGWTQLTSAVVSELDTDDKTFLFTRGGSWYRSPVTTATWSYTSGSAVTGTWTHRASGATADGTFACSTSAETVPYGIGCSNGAGASEKLIPWSGGTRDTASGEISVCQDVPGLFGGGCVTGVQAWVRYE